MCTPTHIAIVDDHPDIRELVSTYLRQHGYRVSEMSNAKDVRELLKSEQPDLIILDIMMPGEDGLALCRALRATITVPIIFLSAMSDDLDVVLGLELGADDYVTKPFNPRELLARIKAVLRRAKESPADRQTPVVQRWSFGPWTLNVGLRELVGQDGIAVALSTSEFKLLTTLLGRPNHILTRDELMDKTLGRDADYFDRAIDNQISRLRRKIEVDPKNPTLIKTHWGGGYSLAAQVEGQ